MADLSPQLLEQIREARSRGERLQVVGGASKPWMRPGGPRLSLAGHSGVISYDPSELVITVRAGTRLSELDAVLAERGQMLAMEAPDFNGGSTIGGAVALGWSGSRSAFAGGVRDAVLGLRMVNGLGEELRFGGQVVKNVAGFDVSRLMAGSCGRLGVILDLSLKVVPKPEHEITLSREYPNLASARADVADWQRQAYPVSGASFHQGRLHVRFSGYAALLDDLAARLDGDSVDGEWWQLLRRLELPLFHHGWGDEKLFDGNGDICWTAHSRRRREGAAVNLATGPDWSGAANAGLLSRVVAAFDPEGLFQPGNAG